MSCRTAKTVEYLDRHFRAAPQTCRPNFEEVLKTWKRPIASSTRRGSIFEVDTEIKRKKNRVQQKVERQMIAAAVIYFVVVVFSYFFVQRAYPKWQLDISLL
ncbi:hypothetical protein ElyMa_000796800 [Elysia marginata]|uniref:Uncharacterized protein n=1 Tax=Elysia marginata TaxID=1093978 RepID=A0AAV4GUJ5_9GAST|nr:hypothetical protein ElyMa_000796800 [Elysia marginata]